MSARKADCQEASTWLRKRGWSLAPLTGQDWAVLRAIAHCWNAYFFSDAAGQAAAIDSVAALLDGCQECVWPMARELIAQAGDWPHRDKLWPKVVESFRRRVMRRWQEGMVSGTDMSERLSRLARCHIGLRVVEGAAQ